MNPGFYLRNILLLMLITVSVVRLNAQAGSLALTPSPQSPDVVALGKFVEMPVGYYSGIPNISIPLYSLDVKGFQLPIGLSYNASGLKVKEVPGSTGAGWSLNAGGMITRVVRGYPDDHVNTTLDFSDSTIKRKARAAYYNGFSTQYDLTSWMYMTLTAPGVISEDVQNFNIRRTDTEYDLFYFNFLNHTGKFTFTNDGRIIIISGEDLKVNYSGRRFNITDAEGVQFYFDSVETALDASDPYNSTYAGNGGSLYVVSWYLSKIFIPRKNQTINFSYKSFYNYQLYNPSLYMYGTQLYLNTIKIRHSYAYISEGNTTPGNSQVCGPVYITNSLSLPHYFTTSLFLKEISWGNNKIKIYGDTGIRADCYRYKVDSIKVLADTQTIKKIKFNYGYFNNTADARARKLRLDSVDINSQVYRLKYYTSYRNLPVPGVEHPGHDIWGYYNGETAPYPNYKFYIYANTGYFNIPFGNSTLQNPDYRYAQLGSLSSIQYPTGGKSLFEYESNDFSRTGFLSSGTLEEDRYTQLLLDSGTTVESIVSTNPSITGSSLSETKDFIIHKDQTVTAVVQLGLNQITTYTQYLTYTYPGSAKTRAYIQKYDEASNTYFSIDSFVVSPIDTLGNPGSEYNFETLRYTGTSIKTHTLILPEGRYRVYTEAIGYFMATNLTLYYQFSYKKNPNTYLAGGLRIKKVQFISGTGNDTSLIKTYSYTKDTISSGVLESPFSNICLTHFRGIEHTDAPYIMEDCSFLTVYPDPIIPLGNSQGGIIGYSQVSETRSDNSKTVYYFTNGADSSYFGDNFLTFLVDAYVGARTKLTTDNSWKRGLLYQTNAFNATGSLVKQDFVNYYFALNDSASSTSFCIDNMETSKFYGPYYFINTVAHHTLKTRDSSIVYSPAGNNTNVTNYEYAALPLHPYLKKVSTRNSFGEYTIANYKYLQDYSPGASPSVNMSKGLKQLQDLHITSPVIEKYVQKKNPNGSNLRTVDAELVEFDPIDTKASPARAWHIENRAGLNDFQPAAFTSSSATIDSRYKAYLNLYQYDSAGNVNWAAKTDEQPFTYIWDYNRQYLVAEITNAGADQVAYTSFEAEGKGFWGYTGTSINDVTSPTGTRCYSFSGGNISRSGLNNLQRYIVSYWSKNGSYSVSGSIATLQGKTLNGWTYYEHTISGVTSTTISGSGSIDEVKLYPKGASIKTFTYQPLVGITSQCDANNKLLYYQYDDKGRLSVIRDENKNIIKKVCYNYSGQVENCN